MPTHTCWLVSDTRHTAPPTPCCKPGWPGPSSYLPDLPPRNRSNKQAGAGGHRQGGPHCQWLRSDAPASLDQFPSCCLPQVPGPKGPPSSSSRSDFVSLNRNKHPIHPLIPPSLHNTHHFTKHLFALLCDKQLVFEAFASSRGTFAPDISLLDTL